MWYGMYLAVRYGKNAVCGMVRSRYGTMVPYREYILWLNLPGGMVFFIQYIRSVRVEYVV